MAGLKKFAALAAAAEAVRRYVQENPEKADLYLGKAAEFADKRTKGKYSRQIHGAASTARKAALGKERAVGGDAADPNGPDSGPPGTQDRPQAGSW